MTTPRPPMPVAVGRGLSARILLLVVAFLLVGEVLIFVPSISRFREAFLRERIAAAHLASLAPIGTPEGAIDMELEDALLLHSGTLAIIVRDPAPRLMLGHVATVDKTYNLDRATVPELIFNAFDTLNSGGRRLIRVTAGAPMESGTEVEIVLAEAQLWTEMVAYARRILALSLVLSLIVALLVLWRLQRLIVRPLGEITEQLAQFRRQPEDASLDRLPSRRRDEIGIVERELHDMQQDLRQALLEKARLAAVGEAVSRINHDLRNMLAGALLVSDRLERSDDPAVRRATPRLVRALERATRLCEQTLDFARSRPSRLRLAPVPLRELIADVTSDLGPGTPLARFDIAVTAALVVRADRDALFRVLANLVRNALAAMPEGGVLRFAASVDKTRNLVIEITDTGPGIPQEKRGALFEPFAAGTSPNGFGLGLAICREIMRRHGGDIRLVSSGPKGTCFALDLPARAVLAAGA